MELSKVVNDGAESKLAFTSFTTGMNQSFAFNKEQLNPLFGPAKTYKIIGACNQSIPVGGDRGSTIE
jgi:hypothetical protein